MPVVEVLVPLTQVIQPEAALVVMVTVSPVVEMVLVRDKLETKLSLAELMVKVKIGGTVAFTVSVSLAIMRKAMLVLSVADPPVLVVTEG